MEWQWQAEGSSSLKLYTWHFQNQITHPANGAKLYYQFLKKPKPNNSNPYHFQPSALVRTLVCDTRRNRYFSILHEADLFCFIWNFVANDPSEDVIAARVNALLDSIAEFSTNQKPRCLKIIRLVIYQMEILSIFQAELKRKLGGPSGYTLVDSQPKQQVWRLDILKFLSLYWIQIMICHGSKTWW